MNLTELRDSHRKTDRMRDRESKRKRKRVNSVWGLQIDAERAMDAAVTQSEQSSAQHGKIIKLNL